MQYAFTLPIYIFKGQVLITVSAITLCPFLFINFVPQVHPTVLTLCRLWTWRESLFLSWEPDLQEATGWRLYNFWSMNRVCMSISECC